MNLTVLLISAFLPLPVILFAALRSGAFGRGSIGMLLRLLFLGAASAVPAFLMEAGGLLLAAAIQRILFATSSGGAQAVAMGFLRHVLVIGLLEEGWKLFILRATTWKKMTMETVGDGIAASVVVASGFSIVLYCLWHAGYRIVPSDMDWIRAAMPEYLGAGSVAAFLFALLYAPCHFGYGGFMGALYSAAKGAEQKGHEKRSMLFLFLSLLLPVLAHGTFSALLGYGIANGQPFWTVFGFLVNIALIAVMAGAFSAASASSLNAPPEAYLMPQGEGAGSAPAGAFSGDGAEAGGTGGLVDFGDSEEFAEFAEASGSGGDAAPAGAEDVASPADAEDVVPETETEAPAGSDASPLAGSMLPGAGDILPGTGGMLPEAGIIVPGTADVLPYAGSMLPETGNALPGTGGVLPGKGNALFGTADAAAEIECPLSGTADAAPGNEIDLSGAQAGGGADPWNYGEPWKLPDP